MNDTVNNTMNNVMNKTIILLQYRTEITLASVLFMFVALVFAGAGNLPVFTISLCIGMILLFLPYITRAIFYIYHTITNDSTILAELQGPGIIERFYSWLISYQFFAGMALDIRNKSLSSTISSGALAVSVDPTRKIILLFVISIPVSIVTSVSLFLITTIPYFLAILSVPLIVMVLPRLSNILKSSDMSSYYDTEFAYFLSYLQISTLSGFGLYHALRRLIGRDIFIAADRDAIMLKKWVSWDGYAESTAVERLAEKHSHAEFRSFLFSYCDIARSNPNGLNHFVTQTADEEFEKIIQKDEKKITKISTVFIYGAMAMIMAPVMMLTLMFMQSDGETISMITGMIFLLPVLFVLYVFVSQSGESDVKLYHMPLSIIGICAGIPWYFVSGDILESAVLSACIISVINGMYVQRQISEWRSRVDGFPKFVRDLIERYKVDSNFVLSIKRILLNRNNRQKYGMFCDVLESVNTRMYTISEKSSELFFDGTILSRRMRLMMFILQTVFDGGHYSSISSLERIHSFSVKLNSIKNRIDDSARMSAVILYISPTIFFIAMVGFSTMLLSFGSGLHMSDSIMAIPEFSEIIQTPDYAEFLDALKPAVVIMSVCAGIVISKIAYSSILATMPAGICLGISFVILVGWDFFFDMVNGMVDFF